MDLHLQNVPSQTGWNENSLIKKYLDLQLSRCKFLDIPTEADIAIKLIFARDDSETDYIKYAEVLWLQVSVIAGPIVNVLRDYHLAVEFKS